MIINRCTTNVEGTRNVIEAAGSAGCNRIVYTSTVGCIGLPQLINGIVVPSDESATVPEVQLTSDYKRSKWQAEDVATRLAREGPAGHHRQSFRAHRSV
jgi:dihydroflavonol-4-reductase